MLNAFVSIQGGYWGETGWAAGDEHDAAARAAYEALLRVSLKLPTGDKFDDFADKVKARAKDHYNYSFSDGEEVRNISYLEPVYWISKPSWE